MTTFGDAMRLGHEERPLITLRAGGAPGPPVPKETSEPTVACPADDIDLCGGATEDPRLPANDIGKPGLTPTAAGDRRDPEEVIREAILSLDPKRALAIVRRVAEMECGQSWCPGECADRARIDIRPNRTVAGGGDVIPRIPGIDHGICCGTALQLPDVEEAVNLMVVPDAGSDPGSAAALFAELESLTPVRLPDGLLTALLRDSRRIRIPAVQLRQYPRCRHLLEHGEHAGRQLPIFSSSTASGQIPSSMGRWRLILVTSMSSAPASSLSGTPRSRARTPFSGPGWSPGG